MCVCVLCVVCVCAHVRACMRVCACTRACVCVCFHEHMTDCGCGWMYINVCQHLFLCNWNLTKADFVTLYVLCSIYCLQLKPDKSWFCHSVCFVFHILPTTETWQKLILSLCMFSVPYIAYTCWCCATWTRLFQNTRARPGTDSKPDQCRHALGKRTVCCSV